VVIKYTRSGDHHLAYEAEGEGDVDLLHMTSMMMAIDSFDGEPHVTRYYRRLRSFARVIHYDPRGIGRSDPLDPSEPNSIERAAADAVAVLDAAGTEKAAVVAWSGAGAIGVHLAVHHPDRVSALVLGDTFARLKDAPDYPEGIPAEIVDSFVRDNPDPDTDWDLDGSDDVELLAPSMANDPYFREWLTEASRRSASPVTARTYLTMTANADVRAELAEIAVPTLVLHRRHNRFTPARLGRYLAEHIPGAKLVVLPGADQVTWTVESDALLDEVEEFLTGRRSAVPERVLATVLFTDIVDSTGRAASLGDHAWRTLLDTHDALVREEIRRWGGREVNTTGDGFLSSFDSPTQAVRAARAMVEAAQGSGIAIRAGLHTGECERRGDDLAGLTVHIAARVAALAASGEVLVSRTVRDLVSGSDLQFVPRGEHELKGVPDTWQLFALAG
jgi:class 3 adenylate cyclase